MTYHNFSIESLEAGSKSNEDRTQKTHEIYGWLSSSPDPSTNSKIRFKSFTNFQPIREGLICFIDIAFSQNKVIGEKNRENSQKTKFGTRYGFRWTPKTYHNFSIEYFDSSS